MTAAAASIRRFRVSLAVEGWQGSSTTLFSAGNGLLLSLLADVDPAVAARLHDGPERKPYAVSPVVVTGRPSKTGRAEFTVATWSAELGDLIGDALARTLDRPSSLVGHPACVLDAENTDSIDARDFLKADPGPGPSVRVRFASPTFFSFGRGAAGHQRYVLLPDPGLVVGSWLRAWVAAGGDDRGVRADANTLREAVDVRWVGNLWTVPVSWGKSPLTGFLGEVGYVWAGPEPWGADFLATLARFATFCGTGAKTAHGFGWTAELIHQPNRAETHPGGGKNGRTE